MNSHLRADEKVPSRESKFTAGQIPEKFNYKTKTENIKYYV
jgi:hypothetical protein